MVTVGKFTAKNGRLYASQKWRMAWFLSRVVHGSGWASFGPNLDSTCQRRVEGGGTRTRPVEKIGRVGFG